MNKTPRLKKPFAHLFISSSLRSSTCVMMEISENTTQI